MPGIILSFSERAADKKTKSQPIWNLCFDKHFQCLDSSTSENSIIQITFCNALRMFLFYKHKHSDLNKKLRIAIFRTFLHIKIIAFSQYFCLSPTGFFMNGFNLLHKYLGCLKSGWRSFLSRWLVFDLHLVILSQLCCTDTLTTFHHYDLLCCQSLSFLLPVSSSIRKVIVS